MSRYICFASDTLFSERPNPHERLVSVNEALAMGVENIHSFLLEDGFDRDKPNVILVADREVNFDIDRGIIEDGGFDDDFSVWIADDMHEIKTKKKNIAVLDIVRYTDGRAEQIISYLKDHFEQSGAAEIELWNCWLGSEDLGRLVRKEIGLSELSIDIIFELINHDPLSDLCITVSK